MAAAERRQTAKEAVSSYRTHAGGDTPAEAAALQRGALFLKYCRRGKPHACFVELLEGGRVLQWVTAVGKPRTLSLEAVREVLAGQQTAVFRRMPGLQPPAVSFSVVYRDNNTERTLDLVSKGREQYDVWLSGLRAAVARCSARAAASAQLQGRALPDEVLFWGHHAATPVTGLGAPKRDRAAPLAVGRGADAWHSKALMPTLFGRAEGIPAAAMSFGPFHGALLSSSGGVYTWGASHCGELGHGLRQHSGTPRLVEALQRVRVRQVGCGTARTAAVTEDGQLLMWGNLAASRCARFGDTGPQWTPRVLCGPSTGVVVRHVACGPYHTAIVSADGQLYTMGEGVFGALGHGDDAHRAAPSLVQGLSSSHVVVQAASGVWHTAALARPRHASSAAAPSALELFTWGQGDRGQLGNGVKGSCELSPRLVDSGQADGLLHVACGAAHTAVLTAVGAVLVSGKDSTGPSCASFRRVLGPLAGVRLDQLACGDKHTCVAASEHGLLFTWGTGAGGRLGHGGERDEELPKLVESLRGRALRSIICGPECTAVICAPQRLTTDDKATMAKAQDEAGWSVAEADTRETPDSDAAGPTESMADVTRALRAAKAWKAVISVAPLASGTARGDHGERQIADAQIATLQLELSTAREEAQLLRAQVATEAHAQRTQVDVSTMTDAVKHVTLREPTPLPPVVTRPVAAPPLQPVEEVITVSPGVHVVAVGRLIRRVRFDRRLFSDEQAVDWWEHQRDKVLGEHHLVCIAAPPRATTASAAVPLVR